MTEKVYPIMPRISDDLERIWTNNDNIAFDIRVGLPGYVESFDPVQQTVTVQLAIRENIKINGVVSKEEIPLLPDVPVYMPRAGGYLFTLPIKKGDECFVMFADCCIDAWWQSGGIQNQVERRRHDLSDGIAFIGIWSQPRRVSGYSADTAQLRNESGSAYVELDGDDINIVGGNVTVKSSSFKVDAGDINIDGSGTTKIDDKQFLTHRHSGVDSGSGTSGGVA